MVKYFFILVISIVHFQVQASCSLPRGETLTIGCSTSCLKSYRNAIYTVANSLNYRVKIIDMYNQDHQIDFNRVDAFIVPGGVDIDPIYYKNHVENNLREKLDRLDHLVDYTDNGKVRDPFEYKLWRSYFNSQQTKNLPALGICRGMQMMAVSQHIPLYIDINAELGIPNRRDLNDRIYLTSSTSRLKDILDFTSFWAHKNHHQGIRVDYFHRHQNRWPHLTISAYSNSGKIAESLEASGHMALGVQFHPEQDRGQERYRIFKWLLENGCHHKKTKIHKLMN